jgi:putative membrane protein
VKWFIVFHLFGAIFWVGGLLIVSSIFGVATRESGAAHDALIRLTRRLFNSVCNAGAVITIIFGILIIASEPQVMAHGWLHVKLAFVASLIVLHVWMLVRGRRVGSGPGTATRREFLIVHSLISVALLAILAMVIIQPF